MSDNILELKHITKLYPGVIPVNDFPLITISPCVGVIAPLHVFIRVDFPAPFSPTRARISPLLTSRETSFKATTPGS